MGENLGTYRVTYLSDKGKADDQVEFVDYLYSFEKVDGGQAADDIPVAKPIKSILEQLNELGKSIADFFIDLFGQNPEKQRDHRKIERNARVHRPGDRMRALC